MSDLAFHTGKIPEPVTIKTFPATADRAAFVSLTLRGHGREELSLFVRDPEYAEALALAAQKARAFLVMGEVRRARDTGVLGIAAGLVRFKAVPE